MFSGISVSFVNITEPKNYYYRDVLISEVDLSTKG